MTSTPARPAPPEGYQAPSTGRTLREKPTEKFVTAAIGLSFLVFLCGVVAADHLPFGASWLLDTVVFTGAFAGMTRWKRNPWGWVWTGYVAAVALAELIAYAAGASRTAGGLYWVAGGVIAVGWVIVLRLPRYRAPEPAPVRHVVNHYVFHGLPDGAVAPLAGRIAHGEVVQDAGVPAVTAQRQSRAIEAPRVQDSLGAWLTARIPVKLVRR